MKKKAKGVSETGQRAGRAGRAIKRVGLERGRRGTVEPNRKGL
jgi:hypothetical protein